MPIGSLSHNSARPIGKDDLISIDHRPLVLNHYFPFQMKGDIFTFFLLSVALTLHGTEASNCRSQCCNQCEVLCQRRGREGRNCCFGSQGGYGESTYNELITRVKKKYNNDDVCRRGSCDLGVILGEGYTCHHYLK